MSLTWEEKLQNTEQKQEDRRHALEKMGISVQSSGIKVYPYMPGREGENIGQEACSREYEHLRIMGVKIVIFI